MKKNMLALVAFFALPAASFASCEVNIEYETNATRTLITSIVEGAMKAKGYVPTSDAKAPYVLRVSEGPVGAPTEAGSIPALEKFITSKVVLSFMGAEYEASGNGEAEDSTIGLLLGSDDVSSNTVKRAARRARRDLLKDLKTCPTTVASKS